MSDNTPHRILVIEDDRQIATNLATLLLVAGFEVEMAFDGVMAVETAESFRPHLCLIDLNVLRLNIYDLARCLRERLETMPFLGNVTPFMDRDDWDSDAEFDLDFTRPSDPMHVTTQVIDFLRGDLPKLNTEDSKVGKPRMPNFRR